MSSGSGGSTIGKIVAHPIKTALIVCTIAAFFLAPALVIGTTKQVGYSGGVGIYAVFAGLAQLPKGFQAGSAADDGKVVMPFATENKKEN